MEGVRRPGWQGNCSFLGWTEGTSCLGLGEKEKPPFRHRCPQDFGGSELPLQALTPRPQS